MKHYLSSLLSLVALLFACAAITFLSAFEPVMVEAVPTGPTRLAVRGDHVSEAVVYAASNPGRVSGAALQSWLASLG